MSTASATSSIRRDSAIATTERTALRRWLGHAVTWTANAGVAIGWLSVVMFLVGEILSDRHHATQWLSWIPTEAAVAAATTALGAAGLGVALSRLLGEPSVRRRGLKICAIVSGAMVAGLVTVLLLVEHRPWRSAPDVPEDALRVLHWNPRWPDHVRSMTVAESLEVILDDHPAELIVLTDPGRLLFDGRAGDLALRGLTVVRSGSFAVLTPLRILEMRSLVRFEKVDITLLRLDTSQTPFGLDPRRPEPSELTVWLVDLPSDLSLGRMALVRRVRGELDGVSAPAPDLVLGDTNMTRRSHALRTLAPGTRNAFGEAGRGWGATFREPYPLWHVDHMMIADSLDALDYATIHTGASRHRAQHGTFRRRPTPPDSTTAPASVPRSAPEAPTPRAPASTQPR